MNGESSSLVSRLIGRVFPRMPDFYGLINQQCELAVEVMAEFVAFMSSGDQDKARQVRKLEKRGDELKARNIDVLNKAFSTPMDREDLYRAIITVDHIINYAKTTIREMEVLNVQPDSHMLEMAELLQQGVLALQRGFGKLSTNPASAEEDANAARKAERNTEKIYRRALADLLDPDQYIKTHHDSHSAAVASIERLLEPLGPNSEPVTLTVAYIIDTFKRREVYRHLSNAADRLAHAGEVLHDIIVKIC
jgi:uncharacterized protein Yka (UPF0111/DUF47 family)